MAEGGTVVSEVGHGVVSTRYLTHHTSEVLHAVEEGRPILISRHNRIVAAMVPVATEDVAKRFFLGNADIAQIMKNAQPLDEGTMVSASDAFNDD